MREASPTSSRSPLRSFFVALLVLALVALLLVGGAYFFVQQNLAPADERGTPVEFEVEPGWGAQRVAQELAEEGLIRQPRVFSLWLRYQGLDRSIGEGLFDLSPAMSAPEIAERLAAGGRPRVVRVTIPEGFRAVDTAARLAEAGLGSAENILSLIQNPGALRPDYVPEDAGLEGYLFPAAYEFPVGSSPDAVLSVMLSRFEEEIDEEVLVGLEGFGLSVHEWVTLASMIQAEAGNLGEMPIISGVFWNRLGEGMLLQSDPTVAYGLGKRLPELNRSEGDFTAEADHAWNTYTRPGLPVGPINSPGREALRAVLAPQRLNPEGQAYLYFLHSPDGIFRPNLTLEDHERDVQEYLR